MALERARDVSDGLARDRPAVPRFRERAAKAESLLAQLLRDAGRLDDAEALYRSAVARWEELLRSHPDARRYRADLGQAYYALGSLDALHRLRPAAALPWYDRSIAVLAPAWAAEPSDPVVRRALFMSHFGRVVALGLLRRHLESFFEWDRAVELADPSGREAASAGRRSAAEAVVGEVLSMLKAEVRRRWPLG